MLGGKGKGGRVGQRESSSATEVSPCLRVANLQKIFFSTTFLSSLASASQTLARTRASFFRASVRCLRNRHAIDDRARLFTAVVFGLGPAGGPKLLTAGLSLTPLPLPNTQAQPTATSFESVIWQFASACASPPLTGVSMGMRTRTPKQQVHNS
jgi:hypothetical protein